ncbi:alpha-tocopherol transfer protein-like [Argiope bruennichi]|uniref:Alpha-tocopherol transfer protein-like n=1 Tax=Argiope bruennichi TaxID=94029 RepID=A0A8T0EQN9_ARGBR|nr:alpha-tocopherol transfer protein-like [Argiope bruennichi]KAF8778037.1 Alpha-tocopherol transfer protein-like [Argiope bruennichi]
MKGIAPFDNDTLPEFALNKCELELKETPEKKQNGLQELKKTIQEDVEINDIDFLDDFLIQYLRRHKYDVKGAYKQIRNYVTFRKKEGKLFQGISDEYFTEDGAKRILKVLPFRCPDGCPVVHCRLGEWNPGKMPVEDFKRLAILTFLQLFRDPMTQINGIKTIYDFKGTSLQHLKVATIGNMYLYYTLALNCFPGRYKAMHMVNESRTMTIMWMLLRPFLPEKIRKRVHFHAKVENLLNYFPASMLPTEYGGNLREYDIRDWPRIANKEQKNHSLKGQPNFY